MRKNTTDTPSSRSENDRAPAAERRDEMNAQPPAAGSRQVTDEDFASTDQPVLPNTKTARALQAHPPKGEGQLGVGTGGDAARPGKEGIDGKPIPQRGHM